MNATVGALGTDADQAAGLLTAVGRSAGTSVDAAVRLRCLLAAEELCAAGAIPGGVVQLADDPDVITTAIRTALALLATLPADIFVADLVADAAADARAALAALP